MVKRLLLILVLLAGSVGATISVTHDTLLSQIPITTGDSNVSIGGTAVITVDASREFRLWTQGAGTRLRFSNTGHTVTFGGLRNLGRIDTIGSTDALEIKNRDLIAADSDFVCWGAGSVVMSGNASRTAAIRGISVGGVKPAFYYRSTSGSFNLAGGRVSGFYKDLGSGYTTGLILAPTTNRTVSGRDVYISSMIFDSCALQVGLNQTLRGFRIDNCVFNLSNTDGFIRTISPCDTFYRLQILHNHNGAAANGYGILLETGADSSYVYGCHIDPLGASGENTLDRGIQVNAAYVKMDRDTVHGCRFNVVTTSSNSHSAQLLNSVLYGASHEQLHWEGADADSNWTVYGNLIYGGGARSLVTIYSPGYQKPTNIQMKNLKFWYNTVVSTGGGKSAFGFDCPNGTNCGYVAPSVSFVGNIFAGANPSYSSADILLDGYTVTFTEFKKNVFDKLDTTRLGNSGDITAPYVITDSNKISSAFGFVDSGVIADYRLKSEAPILNCGDSAYFVQIFGNVNPFGDPGYYQSYSTGTCGGAPPTPTGACCYNTSTCAVMTQAQCTSLSGTYQGDGTSTCANCTQQGGGVTGPSPYSKQLRIASLCYYAPWWSGNNLGGYQAGMRDWAANRYAMLITVGATPSEISYIKSVNPNIKTLLYSKFGRAASDTATLRAMCDTLGLNFRNVILHTGTANVTTTMPVGGDCYGCTASMTTTADSSPILFHYWQAAQTRVSLDPRNWQSGALLWRILKYEMRNGTSTTTDDWDGIMLDEETRWTGTFPSSAPIMPISGDTWATSIINPFTGITAFADSQASWRGYWAKTLGDSAVANSKLVLPNGTSYWGVNAGQSLDGWNVEGRHATKIYKGAFLNEDHRSYYYNSTDQLKNWPKLAYDLRDSGVNMVLAYIPVGMVDSACGSISFPRQKMNFLAHALNCTFSGTTNVYFSPKWSTFGQYGGSNDVHQNYSSIPLVCRTISFNDTIAEWSPTWGKYFGLPVNTKDTSQSGTDGAGQAYKVFRSAFTHPTNGTGDTLTISLMRYDQGTTNTGATAINATLPSSHTWYELLDNTFDSAGIGAANQSLWRATGFAGGSTITLMNSQARVFSSDTTLANTGFGQASTGTISVGDASVTEGGTATFTVTLSQAQSVLTSFNYSTANGTALSGTDYTATSGSKSIAIGSTSTTITVPTTNRSGCQATRAFSVTISTVSPATLTVSDATGDCGILDDDCGTTYGKTYKGKIVIKGKVKP